jgi:hypothetical protein
MPRKPKEKVLVLARYEDIGNYAVRRCSDIGIEADKAMTNEQAVELLANEKTIYFAAVFGNVFWNKDDYEEELAEMKKMLDDRSIPYAKCPTFGDAPRALESIGIAEITPDGKNWQRKVAEQAAIAG